MKKIGLLILVVSFLIAGFVYAGQKERIAVAADEKMPEAAVSSQAGRSSFFLLFDEKGRFLEAISNPYTEAKSRGGAVVGNIVGIIIILILNRSGITFDFGMQKGLILSATIAPVDVLIISFIVILISVIASLQPAFKASRMEPIIALRHV